MRKLFIVLVLLLLSGCGSKKSFTLTLPDSIKLVDQRLDITHIPAHQVVQLEISIPASQSVEKLLVNGVDKTNDIKDGFLEITITQNTIISVSYQAVQVKSIMFIDQIDVFELDLDTFRLTDIQFNVLYTTGEIEVVALEKAHLSETDFLKLFTTGDYFITITYETYTLEALIKMQSKTPQPMLPDIVIYALEKDNIYAVYTIGSYVSYEVNFLQDKPIKATVNNKADGILRLNYNDNELIVMHSFGTYVRGTTHVFDLVYETDVNLSFNRMESKFYKYDNGLILIENVKYYLR